MSDAVDIVVVGGGLAGGAMARAAAIAGLSVVQVERLPPDRLREPARDGRTSAIALAAQRLLDRIGLWAPVDAEACPILDIRVSDGESRLFLHYDHREVGEAPLGWIVENAALRRAIHDAGDGIRLLAPAEVVSLEAGPAAATVGLADGRRIAARLVVAADGGRSTLRRLAGIGTVGWRYRQTAIVCTVRHPVPHGNVAHERFLPAGPFALLPMVDDADGMPRSSVVWTERQDLVPRLMALDDADFSRELSRRFGPTQGPLTVAGGRWHYPLGLLYARRLTGPRLALVGEAAHVVHPIAGQGLNLGLRDVDDLGRRVAAAARLGLDPGAGSLLRAFERARRPDQLALGVVTDGLNRLFSNDLAPVRLARDLGLAVVDRIPPLKRRLMRHAMGLSPLAAVGPDDDPPPAGDR